MQVWFTVQDALQFVSGGASEERAKKNLTALFNQHGAPEGFHRGRWKPADGPRQRGVGTWSAGFTTLKDFMQTQSQLARQSVSVGGAAARSLAMNTKLTDFTLAQLRGQKSKKAALSDEQQIALLQQARHVIQQIVPAPPRPASTSVQDTSIDADTLTHQAKLLLLLLLLLLPLSLHTPSLSRCNLCLTLYRYSPSLSADLPACPCRGLLPLLLRLAAPQARTLQAPGLAIPNDVQGSSSAPAAEEGSARQARVAGAGAKRPRLQAEDATSAAEVAAHQSEGGAVEGRGKRLRKKKTHFGDG